MARQQLQQQHREAVRQAILAAALELFDDQGYEQVTIRSIAAKVGYSPGAIYSYFASKDDIFFTLAEDGIRSLVAGEPQDMPTDSPLDDLRATAQRFYEFSKEQPGVFALIFLDRRVPKIINEYGRPAFMRNVVQDLETRVERCISAGLFQQTLQPAVAIHLLLAPILGIVAQSISNRFESGEDVDALAADAIEMAIAGLRAAER